MFIFSGIIISKLVFLRLALPWHTFFHLLFQLPESLHLQHGFGFSFSSLSPYFLESDCKITSCLREKTKM